MLDAISATDVDSRPALLGNIVCVGGGTCLPGFADRLSYELGVRAPGVSDLRLSNTQSNTQGLETILMFRYIFSSDRSTKSSSMRRETTSNVVIHRGSAAVFSQVLARSINSGSVNKSTKNMDAISFMRDASDLVILEQKEGKHVNLCEKSNVSVCESELLPSTLLVVETRSVQ